MEKSAPRNVAKSAQKCVHIETKTIRLGKDARNRIPPFNLNYFSVILYRNES